MKAIVLLLVAVGTFASHPGFVLDMYSGYSSGVEMPSYCSENPEECGRAIGHMLAFLKKTHSMVEVHKLEQSITPTDVQNLIVGFLTGLQAPLAQTSQCLNDVQNASYNIVTLYNFIINFNINNITVQTVISFLCNGTGLFNINFGTACNFDGLLNHIRTWTFNNYIDYYLKNMCYINGGIINVVHCTKNWYNCGFGLGTAIRLEYNWVLQ